MKSQNSRQKDLKQADRLLCGFLITLGLALDCEIVMRVLSGYGVLPQKDEWQWVEWLFVSLIGVCTYLIWNIALWYRRDDADFIGHTPWYKATAVKGPIIALVVLIALTNVSFQAQFSQQETTTGEEEEPASQPAQETTSSEEEEPTSQPALDLGINFGEASEPVLLVAAYLLGFFSRLTRELLKRIARFLFGSAYTDTYPEDIPAPPAPPAPAVDAIDPDKGKAAKGDVTVTVTGKDFPTNARVMLRRADGECVVGTVAERAVTPTAIRCTFDLTDKAPGKWDVIVVNPDTKQEGTKPEAFEIK